MTQLTPTQIAFLRKAFGARFSKAREQSPSPIHEDAQGGGNPLYEGNGNGDEKLDGGGSKKKKGVKEKGKAEKVVEPKKAPLDEQKKEGQNELVVEKPEPTLDDAKLSQDQALHLKALSKGKPALETAAIGALAAIDGGRGIDADPKAQAKVLESSFEALKERDKAVEKLRTATNERDAAKLDLKKLKAEKLAAELRAGQDESNASSAVFFKDSKAETAENSRKEVEQLGAKVDHARDKLKAKQDAVDDMHEAHTEANKIYLEERKAAEAAADKRSLLFELEHGALSDKGNPKLTEKEILALTAAYGKNPAAGKEALKCIVLVDDPQMRTAFAGHVAFAVDALDAEFQGEDRAADRATMAKNAVLMAAIGGEDYIKGFKAYHESDERLKNDETGGLEDAEADSQEEKVRISEVGRKRTNKLAASVLDKNGNLELDDKKIKSAMDDLLYHPGALKTFTPEIVTQAQMTLEFCRTKRVEVEKKLQECTAPKPGAAARLVSGTLGADEAAKLEASDTRKAVMSAMMTPVAQGSVGSCAATGPLRALRSNEPMAVMDFLKTIASDGTFKGKGENDDAIPANTSLPADGGNPLMRSLEYSIATASANNVNSDEIRHFRKSILGSPGGFFGSGSSGMLGESWPREPEGKSKDVALAERLSQDLRIEFDAGERNEDIDGTGDGSSTGGQFRLFYAPRNQPNVKAEIADEKLFRNTLGDMFIDMLGAQNDRPIAEKAKTAAKSASFSDMGDLGGKPWEIKQTGAHLNQTQAVLSGEKGTMKRYLDPSDQKQQSGERTKKLTEDLLAKFKDIGKDRPKEDGPILVPLGTQGKGADHAFSFMSDGPGRDRITHPNSVASFAEVAGKEVTDRKIPKEQAAHLYENYVRQILNWPSIDTDALSAFLGEAPDKEMTTREFHDHCAEKGRALKDHLASDWAGRDAAKPDAKKKKDELEKEWKEKIEGMASEGIKGILNSAFPPPTVVLADTNWGDSTNHVYFSIGPDPVTGELILWKQKDPGRTLQPADDYAKAEWQELTGAK